MTLFARKSEEIILQAIVRPMSRKDIFYGGSVMQLAEEQVREEKEPKFVEFCSFCSR